MQAEIRYLDRDLIVANKPAGMASQPDRSMGMDLVNWLKNELARQEKSPGEVLVVHRLDRPVGGLIVYARNSQTAARLSAQLAGGRMRKEYLAVLTGRPQGIPRKPDCERGPGILQTGETGEEQEWFRLETVLEREAGKNRSRAVSRTEKGKKAVLEYCILEEKETDNGLLSLAQIHLQTGRHHQIRIQMADAGAGIWGDVKYNPVFAGADRQSSRRYPLALFARSLRFTHPRLGQEMTFSLPAGPQILTHFPMADTYF